MISARRIMTLVMHELFITRKSLEIIIDTLFFPLMNVVLFGYITHFLGTASQGSAYLMLGILLWEIVVINQYNMTVSTMWSVWSHNLTNIYIAPISVADYLIAHVIAAAVRTATVMVFLVLGTWLIFGFNLAQIGALNLVLLTINLSVFAWWIGIVLLGLIFRYGTRIQALAWGTIFLFQPLTAALFPVSVLPPVLQWVAYALPATYMFEAARQALDRGGTNWKYTLIASAMNIGYLVLALLVFRWLFRRSKETGQFARNDLG